MRKGSGKGKGSGYERKVCKRLSLWVTGGEKEDCFWRSAMSGGRATVARKKGQSVRQAGDICAVSPEGHALTEFFYVECKAYRDLDFAGFFLKGTGKLAKFWAVAVREAKSHGREPMLIARQNNFPDIVITPMAVMGNLLNEPAGRIVTIQPPVNTPGYPCEVWSFEELLKTPFVGVTT